MLTTVAKITAAVAVAALVLPTIALAHGDDRTRAGAWTTNQFGVKVLDTEANMTADAEVKAESKEKNRSDDNSNLSDKSQFERRELKSNNGLHLGHFKRDHVGQNFFRGEVTAVSNTGFTLEIREGKTVTVDADSTSFFKAGDADFNLSDITVGTNVTVIGEKSDDTVEASVVTVTSGNLQVAKATGTVTAVNGDTITLETSDDTTITVNTDSNTEFVNEDGETAALSDVKLNMTAKLLGFWDSILNVFNAVKVSLQ
jgi:ribosome maturation factor RimP